MTTTKAQEKAEFGTPQKVFDVTKRMQDIETVRGSARAMINVLFNGERPWTPEEEKKYNIQINVNWGQGQRTLQDANRQLNNAFLHPGQLFQATAEKGRIEKRDEWSQIVTTEMHKPVQRGPSGKRHNFLIQARNATLAMHGVGALWWTNAYRWMPRFVPLEDLLIPTDTFCDMSNLRYFAINMYLTPGELVDMTQGEKTVKGWNKEVVRELLDANKDNYNESTPSTWRDQPEAMAEVFKQNRGYYYSDCVPKIKLRAFYFQEVDEPNRWYRHIIVRETMAGVGTDKFLYDGTGIVFADKIDRILSIQFADSTLVAPLKYHSVRGLGVCLFAPVETLNRLQCELVQHTFEQLKMYFKIQDPADRDRLKNVVLQAYGFIPEGLTIVPREQRHQIDANLVETVMNQMRQVMQENSASFVQDIEKGAGKEMTAFEARARLNQVNVMVSGMLQMMYLQETFYYEEILRRFMQKNAMDPEVKEFRKAVTEQGVPEEMLDPEAWKVSAERVLGSGDQTLAQVQAQWLLEHKQLYDPAAQQKILREATSTMLRDPAKGHLYVPAAPQQATDGTFAAENVFATLMQGVPIAMREGIDQQGYIEALLKMMGMVVLRIQQMDNMGTMDELIGLQNVAKNIGEHIMVFAGDEENKQLVKQYSDVLGKLMNELKGFAQRLMEQQQQQQEAQQGNPEAQAKAASTIMLAKVKAQTNQQMAAMKLQQKQAAFEMDQARKNMETVHSLKREELKNHRQNFNESMSAATRTLSEVRANKAQMLQDAQRAEQEMELEKQRQKSVDSVSGES
jgi:ribosomal protein S17E